MPWFSYHGGHSGQYCGHAKDRLEAIVERAIELGFSHYGLSEHGPRFEDSALFPDEQEAGVQGLCELFDAYVEEARELQERYADRIEILVGFETEKLPLDRWAQEMRAIRAKHDFDYCVGSVHDLDGEWVDFSAELNQQLAVACGGVETLRARYFDSLAELVETLRPEVVGHIDLVRKFDGMEVEFSEDVLAHVERTLEAARAAGSRLDVNCGAFRRGLSPVYPLDCILERAQRMGVGVTLGDDGHGVATVGVGLDACMQAIAKAGYKRVDYLTRRDGVVQWASAALGDVEPG